MFAHMPAVSRGRRNTSLNRRCRGGCGGSRGLRAVRLRRSTRSGCDCGTGRRAPARLGIAEREEISRGLAAARSMRAIAATLRRAPSTVSREVNANGGPGRYRAARADRQAWARAARPKVCKLAAGPRLRAIVEDKLQHRWSLVFPWSCGHVGCCDSSAPRHATAHFHSTRHPVMQSAEPGENWRWCYVDERLG